jgi:hypothetical protein
VLPPPDYDSGWVSVPRGSRGGPCPAIPRFKLTHNLGTIDLLVYLIARDTAVAPSIYQSGYGGEFSRDTSGREQLTGCTWLLNASEIYIDRWPDETGWKEARVRLWKIQGSPWKPPH